MIFERIEVTNLAFKEKHKDSFRNLALFLTNLWSPIFYLFIFFRNIFNEYFKNTENSYFFMFEPMKNKI